MRALQIGPDRQDAARSFALLLNRIDEKRRHCV